MKRRADDEPEGAPAARRRAINSPEPELEPELEERPRGPRTPPGEPPREDSWNPEEQPGPSTSRTVSGEQAEGSLDPEEHPRVVLQDPAASTTMSRRAREETEDAPSPNPEPEPEDRPRGPRTPPGEPPEEQPRPEPADRAEENWDQWEPSAEDIARRDRIIAQTEARIQRNRERRRRRATGEITPPLNQRRRGPPAQRQEPPRDVAPEERAMNVGEIELLAVGWQNVGIPDGFLGNHPSYFYWNQIHKIRRRASRVIKRIKIHAMKLRAGPDSNIVHPIISLLVEYAPGDDDLITYEPYGVNREDCRVQRRGNPEKLVLKNLNFQDQLLNHLESFLMACGDVWMRIQAIDYSVDSNPLIPAHLLTPESNGPEDSFIEQFRTLFLKLNHKTLLIDDVQVESPYRPLREAFWLAEYAECGDMAVKPIRFDAHNVDDVYATVGTFGQQARVDRWIIHTRDEIDENIRRGIRVPGFLTYAPGDYCNIIVLHKMAPGIHIEPFVRVMYQIQLAEDEIQRQNAQAAA